MAKKQTDSLMDALLRGMKASGIKEPDKVVTTIAAYWENMKWIDMYDPITGRPCLAFEWMLGARGFPVGKVTQVRGSYSDAKSTLLYHIYGCALRGSTMEDRKAWIMHCETEGAPNSADYVAKYGCDPRLVPAPKMRDLNALFKQVDIFDMILHGGRDGTVNPETGRVVKSKYPKEEALDPDMKKLAIVGIDSLSNIGTDADGDFIDLDKSEKPGGDSKDIRRVFRAREQLYDEHQLTMFVTTHETTEIKTGPSAGYGGPKSTARNQRAVGMALTIAISTTDMEWKGGKDGKEVLGSKQYLRTFKSKIAPKFRRICLFRKLLGGYDFAETDLQFFMNPEGKNNNCSDNPFMPGGFLCPEGAKCGITKVRGGYSAPMISDKVFKNANEFVEALYSDKERLMKIRELMRIRGFGFPFETQYTVTPDAVEPGTENENEDMEVPAETDAEEAQGDE